MVLTMLQIFLFGPIAASLVDTYGAKKLLFGYVGFFILGSLLWYASYQIDDILWKNIVVMGMIILFAAGFGCRFVDVYTLRTSPSSKTGIAFGIVVMLAGLGRFVGTLIQPSLIQESTQVYGPWIMIGCMIIF